MGARNLFPIRARPNYPVRHNSGMDSAIRARKKSIRKTVRDRIRAVTETQLSEASAQAAHLLMEQEHWINAHSVLLYIPVPGELDLTSCIDQARKSGKLVALPRYLPDQSIYCAAICHDPQQLAPGEFGIPEPPLTAPVAPLNRLDLAVVPGVAFDPAGRRLGRGKGFYDRLLADITGVTCGVALDEQMVTELPEEPHDVAMNYILTPTRFIPALSRRC